MSHRQSKLRWGVLGYARIARESVIPAIQRAVTSDFCAIASHDEARLAICRDLFEGVRVYDNYDELLRDPDIDAVYIPLPNSLHCEWTIKAAELGKHVLCEKPMALNANECRDMIAASVANGITLMEAFMYRYTHRTESVLEVLRSGDLGEIKFVASTFRFTLGNPASIKLQPDLGGGSLYDIGCYGVNFVGMVVDEIIRAESGDLPGTAGLPDSVTAECVRKGGVDVMFSGLMKFPSGLIASVNCGFNAHKRTYSEVVGTNGTLVIPDTFFDNAGAIFMTAGDERREITVMESDRYRMEIEDFAEAVMQRRAPYFSLAETQRNTEIMDLLQAASRNEFSPSLE
jgi:xylose dehydrogenase (NAD/NADP)